MSRSEADQTVILFFLWMVTCCMVFYEIDRIFFPLQQGKPVDYGVGWPPSISVSLSEIDRNILKEME